MLSGAQSQGKLLLTDSSGVIKLGGEMMGRVEWKIKKGDIYMG